jgi:GxxExxY protein
MFHDIAGHEDLTERIIGCGMRVHDEIGPGVFESIYEACLLLELTTLGLRVEKGRPIPLKYRGHEIDRVFID